LLCRRLHKLAIRLSGVSLAVVEDPRRQSQELWRQPAKHATETGLSKSSVQNALRRRKLVAVRRGGPTTAGIYEVLKPWKRSR